MNHQQSETVRSLKIEEDGDRWKAPLKPKSG
jgi:hypothetical protein